MTRRIQLFALFAVSFFAIAALLIPRLGAGAAETSPFQRLLRTNEALAGKAAKTHNLATAGKLCSLSVSIPTPSSLGDRGAIAVVLREGSKVIASKSLHIGDPDLYLTFRAGSAQLELTSHHDQPVQPSIQALAWPETQPTTASVEAEPNNAWTEANEIQLGQTVFATADDMAYIAPLDADTKNFRRGYQQTPEYEDRLPAGGEDWFKFTYAGEQPSLVHFEIDLLERDNIPADVSVFTIEKSEAKPYERGADPVTPPHEVQSLPGNKFTTRILTKGVYYVRVEARHPAYQLRTSVYDAPPYKDPRKAVRAGMDYIVSAGDSWHANTPRHGGLVNRVSTNHNETMGCVACHATHFPLRAEMTARANGYAIHKRSAVQFMMERFYNSPRPFYGFPEADWTRVISASANVMSRMEGLLNLYETEITGERRTDYLKGVVNYLKIYYKGRTALPNDESNGNTPLVSAYEVAWYSWKAFDEYAKQAGDAESIRYREQVRGLVEQDRHKNLIDLCYQTIALAAIDRAGYAEKIRRNAERLLALQRPDGQWSMLFEEGSATVEFQTGHSLYTLALAGYTADDPRIRKSAEFLLARQQEWGGWFDARQSYENFRTPFRETQFAVMALSQLYPESAKPKGWLAPAPAKFADDPYAALAQLNATWDRTDDAVVAKYLASEEPLLRQQAAALGGRVTDADTAGKLAATLNDGVKMVQLAAAWGLRQTGRQAGLGYNKDYRRLTLPNSGNEQFLTAPPLTERGRWGMTRIFAQHFSRFAAEPDFAESMQAALADASPVIRMQAAKSLTQWFYWTKDEALRWRIADRLIARLGVETHPWARRNLQDAVYSIADENVRYLYNNWIALLAQPEDREQARRGHRENSLQMARRIAHALENGNELQREGVLRAITDFHLRAGGYAGGGRYTRIGNDVETIQFYDEGARLVEKAIAPYLASKDPSTVGRAIIAGYTMRDQQLASLPLQVLQQLTSDDAAVRGAAQEVYRLLPLEIREQNRQAAIGILKSLLASPHAAAQTAALERIKVFSAEEARAERLDAAVRDFVLHADRKVMPAALLALADFPHLSGDGEMVSRVASALGANDEPLQRAAAQLAMNRSEWRAPAAIAAALEALLTSSDNAKRRLVLGLVTEATAATPELRLPALLADACANPSDPVRAAALSAARRAPSLLKNPAVKAGLAKLMIDPNPALQEQAVAFYQGQGDAYLDGAQLVARATANVGKASTAQLDYPYFVQRIMPLFASKGRDGNACADCHYNHTVLKLNPPDAQGRWTDAQLRENFASALRVVDSIVPENSLLLRKPLGNADVEGTVGAKKIPHGGGPRWTGIDDAAYKTVLEWINGAKR
ncbi:MAG: hypothetical protein SF339_25330 [Blastocatellia bacterium]|nr:hypothetical protein [Blastocatellia bacterium]